MQHSLKRDGVILAAGFGSRLSEATGTSQLKPLLPIGGQPLILRTLRSLQLAGCARVVIVTGFRAQALQHAIESIYHGPLELVFVENRDYQLKNGVSLLRAGELLGGEFVLTMADHVFGDEVMGLVRDVHPPQDGATLLVDRKLTRIFDMDDATKVLANDQRIVAIGKELEHFNCVDTGVFVCTQGLLQALQAVYIRQGDVSLSEGVQALSYAGRMTVADIGAGFWQDVDTPAMMAHAESALGVSL